MRPPESVADLERIVQERLQESITLDFKRQLPEPSKTLDLAKVIAAMSNTEGGLVIYGIEEDDDSRAAALMPFELAGCTERIALVAQTIDEPVTPLRVYTIEEASGRGFAVVELAFSTRAPHFVNGVAYGRTPKTTTTLSRRRIGELFARSDGFADEFQLRTTKPGRVLVQGHRESGSHTWVSFSNDGESDVSEVDWIEPESSQLIIQVMNGWPFPVPVLRPGQEVRQVVAVALGMGPFTIRTRWRDGVGAEHLESSRVTF